MFAARRTAVLLALIVVLSAALRLAMIFALATYRGDAGAYEHAEIAASVVRGEGFSFAFFHHQPLPSSHQAPAIPLLLAAAYALWGVGSPAAHLALQLVNVAFGVVATIAMYIIARRLWNERVGVWAAAGFAVYLPLVYMTTRIQSINWSIGWLLITLALMIELRDRWASATHIQGPYAPRSPVRLAAITGASAAIGILGEPILLFPLAMFWLLPLADRLVGKPIAWRALLIAGVAALVVMAPWTIRNYCVHGKLMAVKSTFWYVFWQGNNRHATGVDKLAPDAALQRSLAWRVGGGALESQMHEARAQAASVDTMLTRSELLELHALPTEVEKVAWFEQRAKAALAQNPAHYLSMCLRRLAINLWFDPTNPRSYVLAYRLPFLLLAALAIAGLVRGMGFERPRDWLLPALMFAALLVVFTGVITSARFRLLLEAFLFLPAALAAAGVSQWMLYGRRQSSAAPTASAPPRLAA
jgi:hypothetical protein